MRPRGVFPLLLGLSAYSGDSARRTTNETLQGYQRNQCLNALRQVCPEERQSYGAYHQQRKMLQQAEPTP